MLNELKYQAKVDKVLEAIHAVYSEKDSFALLNTMLITMMELSSADAGTLYTVKDNKLTFSIMRNNSLDVFLTAYEKIDYSPIALDPNNIENICAYTALKNEIVAIDDIYSNSEFNFDGTKKYDQLIGYHTKSMLSLPLIKIENGIEEVIGVIQLLNAIDDKTGEIVPFEDVYTSPFLLPLMSISANVLSTIVHAQEMNELLDSFVNVMTQAIDERSTYNKNHTKNVANTVAEFCRFLGEKFPKEHRLHFNKNRIDQIFMACMFHDIGKIITPLEIMDKSDRLGRELEVIKLRFEIKEKELECDYLRGTLSKEDYEKSLNDLMDSLALVIKANTIPCVTDTMLEQIHKLANLKYTDKSGESISLLTPLNMESLLVKIGTLTDSEKEVMKEHVSVTSRLLDEMVFSGYYKDVPTWAKSHHEYRDGSGYPKGLLADDISLEANIITILDIYDSLIASDRPYKGPMPSDEAMEILKSMAGEGKLNSELVELFIESKSQN